MNDDGANARACPSPHGPLAPDEFAERYEAAAVESAKQLAGIHLSGAKVLLARCESPIELALGQEMVLRYCNAAETNTYVWPWSTTTDAEGFIARAVDRNRIAFGGLHLPFNFVMFDSQVKIGLLNWRVDFLLLAFNFELPGHPLKIIIECDGHDFHERTAEQAERDRGRDREAQLAGYRVLRFTGREIWRSAGACVDQVDLSVRDHAMRCAAFAEEVTNG